MAANNIGNASLKLGTDGAGLKQGLAKSEADVKGWASRVGSLVSSAFSPVGAAVAGLAATILHPFEKLKELGALTKQADILGLLPSELAGMNKVLERSGVAAEDVGRVFAVMGRNIVAGAQAAGDAEDKAAHKAEKAAGAHVKAGKAAFQVLGDLGDGLDDLDGLSGKGKARVFQQLGLDLAELKGKNYADQFSDIAEAISKLPKGAEQAAAAMAVFGKSGAQLLPSLQRGKQGIDEIIEAAKRSGAIMTDAQYRDAAKAAAAWKSAKRQIGEAWEGLSNQAVLVAAPIIEFLGKGMVSALEKMKPLFDGLREGFEVTSMIFTALSQEVQKFLDEMGTGFAALSQQSGAIGGQWVTTADVIKGAFLAVGMVVAGIFDILKGVGSGLIWVFLKIVELVGEVVALGATIGLGGNIQDVNETLADIRADRDFFEKQMKDGFAFGNAEDFQKWFLGKAGGFKRPDANPAGRGNKPEEKPAAIDYSKVRQVAAMLEGSKEAYNQEAQFETRKLLGVDHRGKKVDELQLDQLKGIKAVLDALERLLGNGALLVAG